mmetsp:Transcript_5318/g.19464  ORF Transcript_5318/g.19464 Transcript_5318/m.19464 type:complete len:653 (-) Transcript_5318:625-2583(-)
MSDKPTEQRQAPTAASKPPLPSGIKEGSDQSEVLMTDIVQPQRFFLPSISGRKEGFKTTVDDGYLWRKYGEKAIKEKGGRTHPRSYYKCTYPGCKCRKTVELDIHGGNREVTDYKGVHNHPAPGTEEGKAEGSQDPRVKAAPNAARKGSALGPQGNAKEGASLPVSEGADRRDRAAGAPGGAQWQGMEQFLRQAAAGQAPANFEQLQRQLLAMAEQPGREQTQSPISPSPDADAQGAALAHQLGLLNYQQQQLLAQQNLMMMGAQSPHLTIPPQPSPLSALRSPTFGADFNLLSQTALASPHLNMFDTSSLLNSPMPGLQPPLSPMVQIPSPLLTSRPSPSLLSPLGDAQPALSPNLLQYQALLQGITTPSALGGGFDPSNIGSLGQSAHVSQGEKASAEDPKSGAKLPEEPANPQAEKKLHESLATASNSAALWKMANCDVPNKPDDAKPSLQDENLPKNKRPTEEGKDSSGREEEGPSKKQKTEEKSEGEGQQQAEQREQNVWSAVEKAKAVASMAANYQRSQLGTSAQLLQMLNSTARLRQDEQAAQLQMLQSQQRLASLQGLFQGEYTNPGESQKLTLWERRRLAERSMGSDPDQLQTLQLRALLSGNASLPQALPSPMDSLEAAQDLQARQLADLRRAVGAQGPFPH